jgi:hypothetical protein
MKPKLITFRVFHTNEFGQAIVDIKAEDIRDCFNRLPRKIQDTFFEIEQLDTNESITRDDFAEICRRGL